MYSPFRHIPALLRKQAVQLTFFLTRRCNAHCPYCFYLKTDDLSSKEISTGELQLDEIQRISQSMRRILWLAFSGGEIFLRKDLVQISETFYKNNQPVYMLYPTNGQNPDRIFRFIKDIAARCPNSHIIVKLSIDGLYQEHDTLRQTPHSFANTLNTYEQLAGLTKKHPNLELGVNTVFCSENQDRIEDIIQFVQTLKFINTHTLSLVRGNLKHAQYKQVNMEKYRETVQQLAERIRRKKSPHYAFSGGQLKIAQDILQRKLIGKTMEQQQRITSCYAGKVNLVLTESGEVYPCELLQQSMGNVKAFDFDMNALLASHQAKVTQKHVQHGDCYCTHECHMMTNILANPVQYVPLLREYLKIKAA